MIAYIASIAICTVEGLLGLALNCASLFLMLRSSRNLMDRVYRVPMYVCAIHGSVLSFLIAVLNFIALVFTVMMWILIPVHSTLQFIALSRYVWSFEKRLIAAFTIPVACTLCVVYFAPGFLPTPAFEQVLDRFTREVFSLEPQQRVFLYGSTVKYVNINFGRSLVDILIGLAVVPYFVSYGLFTTFAILIRRRLNAFGVSLSARTLKIQRAFHVMQLLQGLLPLAIISVPLIFFIIGTLLQLSFDLATLVFLPLGLSLGAGRSPAAVHQAIHLPNARTNENHFTVAIT